MSTYRELLENGKKRGIIVEGFRGGRLHESGDDGEGSSSQSSSMGGLGGEERREAIRVSENARGLDGKRRREEKRCRCRHLSPRAPEKKVSLLWSSAKDTCHIA